MAKESTKPIRLNALSIARLATCHPDLQKLIKEISRDAHCVVICGHRPREEQNKAVREGKSKLKWPQSKHNSFPSLAVDVASLPLDWNNRSAFLDFANAVMKKASEMSIDLVWGGDWDGDGRTDDEKFQDLVHFELKKK